MTSTEINEFLKSRPSLPAMRLVMKEVFGQKTWNPSLAGCEAFLLDRMVELQAAGR